MTAVAERLEQAVKMVWKGQEVVVRRKNEIGILFHISALLSDKDVNILAIGAGTCGEDCLIRLMTTDNRRAEQLLAENGFVCEEEDIILARLSHQPGSLKQVAKILAEEGLDIGHIYAATDARQSDCLIVLHTSNDEVALARLEAVQAHESCSQDHDQSADMIFEGAPPD